MEHLLASLDRGQLLTAIYFSLGKNQRFLTKEPSETDTAIDQFGSMAYKGGKYADLTDDQLRGILLQWHS